MSKFPTFFLCPFMSDLTFLHTKIEQGVGDACPSQGYIIGCRWAGAADVDKGAWYHPQQWGSSSSGGPRA